MLVELLTAIGVWAAIGYGLDRLFGTGPVLFAIGMVVGAATGIFILYRRALEASTRERRGRS
jgi:ATP synthase protein I